jgi:hybrid cluster-associated redox disulfide protein
MPKQKITKDMKMGEVLREHPETVQVFMEHGLHCVGCQVAFMETIEQGAAAHGIDVDKLLKDLNDAVKE